MKFLKFGGIALCVQILLSIVLGIVNQFLHFYDSGDLVLGIYYPFIMLVLKIGNFKGESGMIEAPILGILLGLFFYTTIIGLVLWFFSKKKYD
jgi:hypothetical protein